MSRSRSACIFPPSSSIFLILLATYTGLAEGNPRLAILNGVDPMSVCAGEAVIFLCSWAVDRPVTLLEINSTRSTFERVEEDFQGHFVTTFFSESIGLLVLTVRLNTSSESTYRCLAQGDNGTIYPSESFSVTVRKCSLQVNGTTPCVSFCSFPIVPVIVSAVVGVILGIVIGLSIAFMLATKLCSCSCSKMDGNLLHMIKGQRQKVNR
jgi:hypothetical protein